MRQVSRSATCTMRLGFTCLALFRRFSRSYVQRQSGGRRSRVYKARIAVVWEQSQRPGCAKVRSRQQRASRVWGCAAQDTMLSKTALKPIAPKGSTMAVSLDPKDYVYPSAPAVTGHDSCYVWGMPPNAGVMHQTHAYMHPFMTAPQGSFQGCSPVVGPWCGQHYAQASGIAPCTSGLSTPSMRCRDLKVSWISLVLYLGWVYESLGCAHEWAPALLSGTDPGPKLEPCANLRRHIVQSRQCYRC